MSTYYKAIMASKINVIAIYDSPTCLFTLNSAWTFLNVSGDLATSYSYLSRLVSVDTSMINYATNSIQVQLPNPASVYYVSSEQEETWNSWTFNSDGKFCCFFLLLYLFSRPHSFSMNSRTFISCKNMTARPTAST